MQRRIKMSTGLRIHPNESVPDILKQRGIEPKVCPMILFPISGDISTSENEVRLVHETRKVEKEKTTTIFADKLAEKIHMGPAFIYFASESFHFRLLRDVDEVFHKFDEIIIWQED